MSRQQILAYHPTEIPTDSNTVISCTTLQWYEVKPMQSCDVKYYSTLFDVILLHWIQVMVPQHEFILVHVNPMLAHTLRTTAYYLLPLVTWRRIGLQFLIWRRDVKATNIVSHVYCLFFIAYGCKRPWVYFDPGLAFGAGMIFLHPLRGGSGKNPRNVWYIFQNWPKITPTTRFFPYFGFFPPKFLTPTHIFSIIFPHICEIWRHHSWTWFLHLISSLFCEMTQILMLKY